MPSHYFSSTQERNNCFDCLLKISWEALWMHHWKEMVNIIIYIISSVMHAFWLVLTYNLLEDRRIDEVIIKTNRFQVATCICSVIDHRGGQNVVRTSVTHSAAQSADRFFGELFFTISHFFVLTTFWCHLWSITEQMHSNLESICWFVYITTQSKYCRYFIDNVVWNMNVYIL